MTGATSLSDPSLGLAPHLAGEFSDGSQPFSDGRNIWTIPFIPDPRKFYPIVYSHTKILLMPSLWQESFGLVAVEAMLNGIPVLASNRGALPETVGDGGMVLAIPEIYTSETRVVPSPKELEHWICTIIQLWDDVAYYLAMSRDAMRRAQFAKPSQLRQTYQDFFKQLVGVPRAPIVPRERQTEL